MSDKTCKNPICEKEVHNEYAGYCQKCSVRGNAKRNGYVMNEAELDLGDSVGFILTREDLV